MPTKNTNTFRATHPIDFDLFDKDSQNVLYIEDSSDQLLTLEIRNASSQDIVLNDLANKPLSDSNYHFALRFRPGTLATTSLTGTRTIQLTSNTAKSNWEMLQARHNDENWDVIYLRKTKELILKCSTTIEAPPGESVVFNHVGADAAQGARGTRVELVCTNMHYKSTTEAINTTREIHLGIINHRGKKNIPWQLGFVGGNTIVNDGTTPNPLKLRIANIAPYNQLNPTGSNITFKYDAEDATKTTKIILSFQTGVENDPWALEEDDVVSTKIKIDPLPGWNIIEPKQGKNPIWILSPTQTINLPSMADPINGTKSHIDINIKNIISNFPCGQTNLYIYYQNIPGYWDGNEACIIEKTPIKVDQGLVEMYGSSSGENIPFQIVALPQSVGPVMGFMTQDNPDQKSKFLVIGAYGNANNIENHDRPLLIKNIGKDNKEVPIARFTTDGKVGIGNITQPIAIIDVAPVKSIPALQLQNGNVGTGTSENQFTLGCYDTNSKNPVKDAYRHSIKTRHNNSDANENAIDFYVWHKGKDNADVIGSLHTLSLSNGKAGIGGVTNPSAIVDVAPLKSVPALQLQNGNISTGVSENQIVLGYNDTNTTNFQQNAYRHAIKTRHNGNNEQGNAIDFYVWDKEKDKTASTVGTLHTMSVNGGKVGINGIKDPTATLDVKGDIKCEYIGTDPKGLGLTVTNGEIWNNKKGGGLFVGTGKSGFFGETPDGGVGIFHKGGLPDGGGWLISGKYGSDTEVTIHGKLFILTVNQTTDSSSRYMAHVPSNHEVAWWNTSDQRLKKNVATLPHALQAIQQLRGVSFEWNEEGLLQKTKDVEENYRAATNTPEDNSKLWEQEKQRIRQENARTFNGFIAQEVEAVFPDWVKEDKDGYKTINMDELAPVMVEAIKSQQQQINTLQAQMEMLMKELKALKAESKL